jgi:hypothetical protein
VVAEPVVDDEADEFEYEEVEKILSHKGTTSNRFYLIKWKGRPSSENEWVPASGFNATHCIKAYWARYQRNTRSRGQ